MAVGDREKSEAQTDVEAQQKLERSHSVEMDAHAGARDETCASHVDTDVSACNGSQGMETLVSGTCHMKLAAENDANDANDAELDDLTPHQRGRLQSSPSSVSVDEDCGIEDARLAYRKIFVGGLSWETTEDDLRAYFSQFGTVQSCQIKYDVESKQPRGFGFVVFDEEDSVTRVLAVRDQHRVRGKRVDPKPAKPSKDVCRKVFVGGIDPDASHEHILNYFSQFGKVESLDLPYDNAKSCRKNYVFVAYGSKHEAIAASRSEKQLICGRMCDVRIALPRDQILKMKSREINQVPIKFAAPQTFAPSAYARNYSAPMNGAQQIDTQTYSGARYRSPYRSGPACLGGMSVDAAAMRTGYMTTTTAQPNPPFHFAVQNGPTGPTMPGQFPTPAPYQLCVVDQTKQQPSAYAPYYTVTPAAATQEYAVQPSMIATPSYPMMVAANGGACPQQVVQPVGQTYAYQTYIYPTATASSYTAAQLQPVTETDCGMTVTQTNTVYSMPPAPNNTATMTQLAAPNTTTITTTGCIAPQSNSAAPMQQCPQMVPLVTMPAHVVHPQMAASPMYSAAAAPMGGAMYMPVGNVAAPTMVQMQVPTTMDTNMQNAAFASAMNGEQAYQQQMDLTEQQKAAAAAALERPNERHVG